MDENAAAAEIEPGEETLRALEETFPVGATAGERYPPESMQTVER